jgi:hypothetical protein
VLELDGASDFGENTLERRIIGMGLVDVHVARQSRARAQRDCQQ